MIKFESLLEQTKTITDIEELESAGDLFQYGLDQGSYTLLNTTTFNKTFWEVKNRIITTNYFNENKNSNYMNLLSIITSAPVKIKEDAQELRIYIRGIMQGLKGKCA